MWFFFVFLQTHMVKHRMPQGDTESPTQFSDGRNGNSNKMKHNNGAIQIKKIIYSSIKWNKTIMSNKMIQNDDDKSIQIK